MPATSLSSLPSGHVEVLLGSQVTALPAGLETFGGTTVTARDFITAADQDGLPADEKPATTTPAPGTQSVNSELFGAHAQAPAHPATNPTSKPSSSSDSSAGDVTVPATAPYGIPCVY